MESTNTTAQPLVYVVYLL